MGRSNPDKGPEVAVEVARRAGLPLVMVVKRAEAHEQQHWERVVAPPLGSDVTVVADTARDAVLRVVAAARAMGLPDPMGRTFGLVMAEALACGTPVITRPLGAAREIVRHRKRVSLRRDRGDGPCSARGIQDLADCVSCSAAERFSADAMIDGYEDVYRRAVN